MDPRVFGGTISVYLDYLDKKGDGRNLVKSMAGDSSVYVETYAILGKDCLTRKEKICHRQSELIMRRRPAEGGGGIRISHTWLHGQPRVVFVRP